MHSHLPVIKPCKWLWKSKCTMKIKVFSWLLFFDRLNTKDLLVRRKWRSTDEDNLCVMCFGRNYEDMMHLFFSCNFSIRVWNYLQIDWSHQGDLVDCILHAKLSFGHPFFFEVLFSASWCIWIVRNGRTFRGIRPSFNSWRSMFIHDVSLLTHRVKDCIRPKLQAWIDSLP